MVEKKCEKNLEKVERVNVRRRYTMKTQNNHIKEPKPGERELFRLMLVL
jgi:hypothetical protein